MPKGGRLPNAVRSGMLWPPVFLVGNVKPLKASEGVQGPYPTTSVSVAQLDRAAAF